MCLTTGVQEDVGEHSLWKVEKDLIIKGITSHNCEANHHSVETFYHSNIT